MTTQKIDFDATMEAIRGMAFTLDRVRGRIVTERNRYGSWEVIHEASAVGRRSETYRETKRQLGDDYTTTLADDSLMAVFAEAEKTGRIRYEN